MKGKQSQNKDKTTQPPRKAVIYARYSSAGQREESIEGQLRDCYQFAKQNNLNVIGEYIDRALSGRSDKRPDFLRMIKDSERGHFEVVITWKLDRFTRSRYDSAMYKARLKKNGVQLLFAKEEIPEGPMGIVIESFMEGFAEYYSANLSENVKRGFYDSALDLKTLGQTVIGYKKGADGRFAIDEGQAAVVRRIFEEYAAGERAKDIYARLNAEGHRTSRGGLFNKNSIRRILQNEKYIGVYEYEDIRDENGIPPIVDRVLFARVQDMVEKNHASPNQKVQTFLLTGKIKCGHCGEDMTGDGGTSRTGKTYSYYTCNKRKYNKTCDKERAPKEWIENLVIEKLVDLLNEDGFIERIADEALEYMEERRDTTILDALEARKKDNEKAIKNVMDAIEQGIITPTTKSRLVELESDKVKIEKGIAKEKINNPHLDRDQLRFFLERYRDADMGEEKHRERLLRTFLNSVFIYDTDDDDPDDPKKGKLVLCMNYTDEHGKLSKITLSIMEKAVFDGVSGGSSFEPFVVFGALR
ncbi:MAG: recombinase family protein [Oscillospiraceae bacterium]|jgi:DNA invertase Pin-like site-specific DNA recombinase|nr:recombinase family protein [Oscillospiraceae bacterium]